MPIAEWNDRRVNAALRRALQRGMTRAALHLEKTIIMKISKGQPPSEPGEPWHVLTGRSRASMTHDIEIGSREIIGRVGSNVVYVRRLELGFAGRDADGRNVNQAPRPAMRPALIEERDEMMRLLALG
jgi:hypothetical protein